VSSEIDLVSAKVNVARKKDDIVVGVAGTLSEKLGSREAYEGRKRERRVNN
jgi:hypothetical protein